MDLESISAGAGSGIVGIILGYFGISKRVDKIESELEKKLDKNTCAVCKDSHDDRLDRIENKIDRLLERGV
jgi:hypothetical protein